MVFALSLVDLAGTHLAPFETVHLRVALELDERRRHDELSSAFDALREAITREDPSLRWDALVRRVASAPGGKRALADWHEAQAIAGFPRRKRALVRELIARHREDKTLVFARRAEDAYAVARESLVPAITASVRRAERERVLAAFREGHVRCLVSARVLNEGVDVPDARVAILLGGALGVREQIQRIGRVLRAAEGKRALVYDVDTADERRANKKWRELAAQAFAPL